MEANSLEKITNKSIASRFFGSNWFDDSMTCQNLRICGSLSPKTILIFPKNFLNFITDAVENPGIINLSSSKGYTAIVLGDFEIVFLEKEKVQPFVHFSIMFWLYLVADILTLAESLPHSPEQAARGIGVPVNSDKTEFISSLNGKPLKLIDQFIY